MTTPISSIPIYIETVAHRGDRSFARTTDANVRTPIALSEIWNQYSSIPQTPALLTPNVRPPTGHVELIKLFLQLNPMRPLQLVESAIPYVPPVPALPSGSPNISAVIPATFGTGDETSLYGPYAPQLWATIGLQTYSVPFDGRTWVVDGVNNCVEFPAGIPAVYTGAQFTLQFYRYFGIIGGGGVGPIAGGAGGLQDVFGYDPAATGTGLVVDTAAPDSTTMFRKIAASTVDKGISVTTTGGDVIIGAPLTGQNLGAVDLCAGKDAGTGDLKFYGLQGINGISAAGPVGTNIQISATLSNGATGFANGLSLVASSDLKVRQLGFGRGVSGEISGDGFMIYTRLDNSAGAGQSLLVLDSLTQNNNNNRDLRVRKLIAGTNITLTPGNTPGSETLTIDAAGGGGGTNYWQIAAPFLKPSVPAADAGTIFQFPGSGSNFTIDGTNSNMVFGPATSSTSGSFNSILGGQSCVISGSNSVICGGASHSIPNDYSVIAGGQSSTMYTTVTGTDAPTTAPLAFSEHNTIGGGHLHNIYGQQNGISCGKSNTVEGNYSTIGGGTLNKVQVFSTNNTVYPANSAVVAIYFNETTTATAHLTNAGNVISGGKNNIIGDLGYAGYNTIAGGSDNSIHYGSYNFVTGYRNEIGFSTSDPGWAPINTFGFRHGVKDANNTVTGYNFLCGKNIRIKAEEPRGSFVWNGCDDNTFLTLGESGVGKWVMRPDGGANTLIAQVITNNGPGMGFSTDIIPIIGPYLDGNSTTWVGNSDYFGKIIIGNVDCESLLAKFSDMSLYAYQFRGGGDSIYYGPTAQDWHSIFYSGDPHPNGISTAQYDGINISLIRGIVERESRHHNEHQTEITSLQTELATTRTELSGLQAELAELRALVQSLRPPA